jgi:hypothetical protein
MTQLLLFPDPRPLVERLGAEFFRDAPDGPGVYLMRDAGETVLYVGKAKNLRKRLASYRVANPDRLPRRHLRLLRAVAWIELRPCADEASALAMESSLLRSLRPRFNRAGTWVGPTRFLLWRASERCLDLAVGTAAEPGWCVHGPLGGIAPMLREFLVRLVWCVFQPQRGMAQMPLGWFQGLGTEVARIPCQGATMAELEKAPMRLKALLDGDLDQFADWIRQCTPPSIHPFEVAAREEVLEALGALVGPRPAGAAKPAGATDQRPALLTI